MRNILLILFIFPILVNGQNVNKWLKKNTYKIKTVQAESGFDDLMPLKKLLEGKRIIALGEATHGTKEFFQMKHRMLEFLVKELGYKNFAIEANFTEALVINEFVMYGIGDPIKALQGIYFWTWDTKEVLSMIKWMREYNLNKQDKDKIKFYGFDMQVAKVASEELKQYLYKVDSTFGLGRLDFFNEIQKISEVFDTMANPNYNRVYVAKIISGQIENLQKIETQMENEKDKYISKSNQLKYSIMKKNLNIISQFFELACASESSAFAVRDKYMSENVKWLLDHEGEESKFVLWAHNGHIAKDYVDKDGLTMGYHLKKIYKEKYYSIGFDFYNGSFRAADTISGLTNFNYCVKKNSTGYIFSKAKINNFFLDISTALNDESMKKFLNDTIPSICIGAVFSYEHPDSFYIKRPLASLFDGIIFIKTTNAAEPNRDEKFDNDFGNLKSYIDAKKYVDKTFKLSAYIKIGKETTEGKGHLWARVDKEDKSIGFFENMDNNPIIKKDWQYYEITGKFDHNAKYLVFGCFFIGKGELYIDDIDLSVKENEQWIPIKLPDSTFESYKVNKKPNNWKVWDKTYKIFVTDEDFHTGGKSIKIMR